MKKSVYIALITIWVIGIMLNIMVCLTWFQKIQVDIREHEKIFSERGRWMKSVDERLDKLLSPNKE